MSVLHTRPIVSLSSGPGGGSPEEPCRTTPAPFTLRCGPRRRRLRRSAAALRILDLDGAADAAIRPMAYSSATAQLPTSRQSCVVAARGDADKSRPVPRPPSSTRSCLAAIVVAQPVVLERAASRHGGSTRCRCAAKSRWWSIGSQPQRWRRYCVVSAATCRRNRAMSLGSASDTGKINGSSPSNAPSASSLIFRIVAPLSAKRASAMLWS